MKLETLNTTHYEMLYEIFMEAEPHLSHVTLDDFKETLSKRVGYVVMDGDKTIGSVMLSDYIPDSSATLHCTIDTEHKGRWLTRDMAMEFFNYCFDFLNLERVSSYAIEGKTDEAGRFLERLGFKHEGTMRHGVRLQDGVYDLKFYGMLKDECKWINNKSEVI